MSTRGEAAGLRVTHFKLSLDCPPEGNRETVLVSSSPDRLPISWAVSMIGSDMCAVP